MNYALVENGTVVNIIWLNERNAGEWPGAVRLGERMVEVGDTYDGEKFRRDGTEVLTAAEAAQMEAAQYAAALQVMGGGGTGMRTDIMAQAQAIRASMDAAAAALTDEQAVKAPMIYRTWSSDSVAYAVGDRCLYGGVLYKCLQGHTSQKTWTPEDAVSLWAKILIPDPTVIPEWQQPESTNPYMKGDKVTHGGKTWQSTIDNNVWEPGVYGWEEV